MTQRTRKASAKKRSNFFEEWVYPDALPPALESPHSPHDWDDLSALALQAWPSSPIPAHPRVLVAGCGATEAVRLAQRNPGFLIYGFDSSTRAIELAGTYQKRYELENLELQTLALEDLDATQGAFHGTFDLILANRVLNVLAKPAKALRNLAALLAPQGVMVLAIPSRHARHGVAMMRELAEVMKLQRTGEDAALLGQLCRATAPQHPLQSFQTQDLSEAGLVQLFLPERAGERSVGECLELLDEAQLNFMGWRENFYYYPEGHVPSTSPLLGRLKELPETALNQAMELLLAGPEIHRFLACKPTYDAPLWKLTPESPELLDLVPVLLGCHLQATGALERPGYPTIQLGAHQAAFTKAIDGERRVSEVFEKSALRGTPDVQKLFARSFLLTLWRLGMLRLRRK